MEILFIKQILEFLGVDIEYPIVVHVDNVGAIYLAQNESTGRTRHVDIRRHFIREFIQDGVLKIVFTNSASNISDTYTKNTDGETFVRHTEKYMMPLPITDQNRKGVEKYILTCNDVEDMQDALGRNQVRRLMRTNGQTKLINQNSDPKNKSSDANRDDAPDLGIKETES